MGVCDGVEVGGARLGFGIDVRVGGGLVAVLLGKAVFVAIVLGKGVFDDEIFVVFG
jgi:hypothetical protein